MKIIYGGRGTGKTKTMFEIARENHAVIITPNAHALKVKAQGYGYNILNDFDIIDIERFVPEMYCHRNIIFHKYDEMIKEHYYYDYDINVVGMTMTEE